MPLAVGWIVISLRELVNRGMAMLDFRSIVFLALWTLLIGPVMDFTQSAPSARAKPSATAKVKAGR